MHEIRAAVCCSVLHSRCGEGEHAIVVVLCCSVLQCVAEQM